MHAPLSTFSSLLGITYTSFAKIIARRIQIFRFLAADFNYNSSFFSDDVVIFMHLVFPGKILSQSHCFAIELEGKC